jgi:hypothetical protein
MMMHDEESQIFYYPTDEKEKRMLTNKDRFRLQREAAGVREGRADQYLGSQRVNKRIPRMIDMAQQLRDMGVKNPEAWIDGYKKQNS